mgnify:CR=1 FL=1
MSCALVAVAQPLLHAETYVIKKLTTPTVRINDQDMKVGDTFTDGAVVYWSSERQAMRVTVKHFVVFQYIELVLYLSLIHI